MLKKVLIELKKNIRRREKGKKTKKTIKISNINRRNERKKSSRRSCSLARVWEGAKEKIKGKNMKTCREEKIWIEQGFLLCCDGVTMVSVLYALVLVRTANDVKLIPFLRPWARAFSTVLPSSRSFSVSEKREIVDGAKRDVIRWF